MTTNKRMKAVRNVSNHLQTVGTKAVDGVFDNSPRKAERVKFYPKSNMGGEVTRKPSRVDWKAPQIKRIPRRHTDHRYTTMRRVLPSCDLCGRVLQEKYVLCSCGLELHVRCIRAHKKAVKQ